MLLFEIAICNSTKSSRWNYNFENYNLNRVGLMGYAQRFVDPTLQLFHNLRNF